jgi:hypothetical protein
MATFAKPTTRDQTPDKQPYILLRIPYVRNAARKTMQKTTPTVT